MLKKPLTVRGAIEKKNTEEKKIEGIKIEKERDSKRKKRRGKGKERVIKGVREKITKVWKLFFIYHSRE